MLGELDRVSCQVEDDLPQSERVADDVIGYRVIDFVIQRDVFLVGSHSQ